MAVSRIIDGEVPLIKPFLVCLNGGGNECCVSGVFKTRFLVQCKYARLYKTQAMGAVKP